MRPGFFRIDQPCYIGASIYTVIGLGDCFREGILFDLTEFGDFHSAFSALVRRRGYSRRALLFCADTLLITEVPVRFIDFEAVD